MRRMGTSGAEVIFKLASDRGLLEVIVVRTIFYEIKARVPQAIDPMKQVEDLKGKVIF